MRNSVKDRGQLFFTIMSPHAVDMKAGGTRNWIMGAEAFERRMPHHDGIKALWETKWKFPVSFL